MTNVLSIDFDYWFDMPGEYDWQFREALFFINQLWAFRAMDSAARGVDIRTTCKVAADEPRPAKMATVIREHGIKIPRYQLAVSESHSAAYKWLVRMKDLHIINIDAHHDMGYSKTTAPMNCDNWIKHLILKGKVKKVTQIYPKWRLRHDNEWEQNCARLTSEFDIPIECHYGIDEWLPYNIDVRKVFICRSGAWVPPWLDRDFRSLVNSFIATCCGDFVYYGWSGAPVFESMFDRKMNWKSIAEEGARMRGLMEHTKEKAQEVSQELAAQHPPHHGYIEDLETLAV